MNDKNTARVKMNRSRCQPVTIWKYLCIMFSLALFTLLRGNVSAAMDSSRTVVHGVVTKVIDGDSLVVHHKSGNLEIRLYGIDAPEYHQAHAADAKAYLLRMVKGKDVKIQPLYRDQYHRVVAFLEIENESVNETLVASGNAWVYPRYCRAEVCEKWKKLQAIAQQKRIGIWQNEDAVPPWRWKHRK